MKTLQYLEHPPALTLPLAAGNPPLSGVAPQAITPLANLSSDIYKNMLDRDQPIRLSIRKILFLAI